jgi:hypothetical protein
VNNLIRGVAAGLKDWQEDMGAALTAGGSEDALTLTTNGTLAALADGVEVGFVAASANTGAATLAVDGLTAKAIRRPGDLALLAGNIAQGGHYTVSYDASANSGNGAWMLHNPTFVSGLFDITTITEETSPAADDKVLFSDTSASGANRQTTWQNILKVLGLITEETAIAADDTVPFNDTSASGAARRMSIADFAKFPTVLDELSTGVDGSADYFLIIDATDGAAKKCLVRFFGAGKRSIDFRACDMVPIPNGGVGAAVPTAYSEQRGATNEIMADGWAFIDSATRKVQIRFKLPDTWDATDAPELQVKLRWIPDTGAGAGDVMWRARAMCLGDGTAIDNAWGTADTVTDTKIGTSSEHYTAAMDVTPADATSGKEVFLEISRLGANAADTMSGDAILTLVEVVYTVTTIVAE